MKKRTKSIKIRVTEEEHQALRARCTKAKLAEWMREKCLNAEVVEQKKKHATDPVLLRQLAAIGNNINQIARRINRVSDTEQISVLAELLSITEMIESLADDC